MARLLKVSGVEYKSETALGKMIVSAWQIFNATGLSEKPELFKKFVAQPGWKANIGVSMGKRFSNNGLVILIFRLQSDPKGWTPGLVSREGWNPSKPVRWDGSEKNTLKGNGTRGSRGPLLQWGNIFVREDSYENPVLYRKAVAEFLGIRDRQKAVELAWRYFRLFGSADFVGYEWYAKNEDVLNEKGEKTEKLRPEFMQPFPLEVILHQILVKLFVRMNILSFITKTAVVDFPGEPMERLPPLRLTR